MDFWHFLLDIVVLLGGALILGGFLSTIGQSALVGYLLAGMILGGPGSVNVVASNHSMESIAELGVALLLFSLGLEFSWNRLKALGRRILLAGGMQVALTVAFCAAVAALLGLPGKEALGVGLLVALSSTACVLRILLERGELDSVYGRNALAILLVQDIAVVPLALIMVAMSGGSAGEIALLVGKIALGAAILIAGLYVLLNQIAVRVLAKLTLEQNRELAIVMSVAIGLGSTWAAHEAGVSPALGAFVAGMFLGGSPFATQVRADIAPLRIVLLTLFFAAAGMVGDPFWIFENFFLVVAVTVALLVAKAVVIWVILQGWGQPASVALASGVALSQIGEFAFVLGSIGRREGVLSEETYLLMVSVTILSLLASPYLLSWAVPIGRWVATRLGFVKAGSPGKTNAESHTPPRVVIIGFGTAGQGAAKALVGQRGVLVVDLNKEGIKQAHLLGFEAEVGDARQYEVLEHLEICRAKAILITVPSRAAATSILYQVRRLAPQASIVMRSRFQRYSQDFLDQGAHFVVGDEEVVGERLREILLQEISEAPSSATEPGLAASA